MSTTNPERKDSILKTLAITGLLGLTILIAWLAIQIVQVFPAALSSLVSLANSVYNYNPLETRELRLTKAETTITAGDPFTIAWERPHASGTYVFSFACTPQLALDLTAGDKTFNDLTCDEKYDLGTTDSVELTINTDSNRLTDLTYTVAFYRPNSATPAASQSATVTVIDATITESVTATTTPILSVDTPPPTVTPEEESVSIQATTTEPITPRPVATPAKPSPVYVYEIPVSDKNGTTDLTVNFLSVGRLTPAGFVSTSNLTAGEAGAFQFAVHNIGTRTSETWTYKVTLPNGTVFTSDTEKALLPNERAVLTLSFPALADELRTATIEVTVTTSRDTNRLTNTTKRTLSVLR